MSAHAVLAENLEFSIDDEDNDDENLLDDLGKNI